MHFFFLLSGFKFPQSNQVTGNSYQQVFTHTVRFCYFLLAHYFPLTYNLNCIKSRVIRHSTNHKGRLLKRVWVGQQGVNTWNRGRPSEDILFQKDWQQEKKGPIQILYHNSGLRYAIAMNCGRNSTSIALNSIWYSLASMLQCNVFCNPFHAYLLYLFWDNFFV